LYAVRGRARGVLRARPAVVAILAASGALLLAGCGGGSRQDATEPAATFRMSILHVSFPTVQPIARPTHLVMLVRNTGSATVPNVAVTIDSFNYASNYPELAANKRPIWVIERGPGSIARPPVESQEVSPPGGGQTAYVNTWALGPLAPGRVRTFIWSVVPVKSGLHIVHYTVSAGLAGKAKARTATGVPVHGRFAVYVTPAPPVTHVNPSTGKVEPGRFTANP
jgi:hypothetical protein